VADTHENTQGGTGDSPVKRAKLARSLCTERWRGQANRLSRPVQTPVFIPIIAQRRAGEHSCSTLFASAVTILLNLTAYVTLLALLRFLLHGGIAAVIGMMVSGVFEVNLNVSAVLTVFLIVDIVAGAQVSGAASARRPPPFKGARSHETRFRSGETNSGMCRTSRRHATLGHSLGGT